MANAKRFYKNLYLQKGWNKKGESIVMGGVKLFVKKPYGKENCIDLRTVQVSGTQKAVCNVQGFLRVDDFLQKQLKYFFNVHIEKDTLIDLDVSVWGKPAETLSKFNVSEGDLYFFLVSSGKVVTFDRKNGETGYRLSFAAFDFEPLKTGSKTNGEKNTAESNQQSAQQVPAQPDENSFQDEFDAIDESEDLPF